MLAQYVPGVAYLFVVSALIALPFAWLLPRRSAVTLSAVTSTVVWKTWAIIAMNGFDLSFLVGVALVALAASLAVVSAVAFGRRHRQAAAEPALEADERYWALE